MATASDPLALTFDDGPAEWTEPILETLEAAGARATFFVLGEAALARPDVLARAAAAGHELGNHGFTHRPLDTLSRDEIRRELEQTAEAVARATGERPRLFRAPYLRVGEAVREVAAELGYPEPVGGELVGDWERESGEEIASEVLARAASGAIVVLHDGRASRSSGSRRDRLPTVAAVAAAVPELQTRGFRLVTVSELQG